MLSMVKNIKIQLDLFRMSMKTMQSSMPVQLENQEHLLLGITGGMELCQVSCSQDWGMEPSALSALKFKSLSRVHSPMPGSSVMRWRNSWSEAFGSINSNVFLCFSMSMSKNCQKYFVIFHAVKAVAAFSKTSVFNVPSRKR